MDFVPNERFPTETNDSRPIQYGMPFWRDLFSPRQLLCHGFALALFREIAQEELRNPDKAALTHAAINYLAISIDTILNYNGRLCRWDTGTERVRSKFDRHDFAFVWSYAEMVPAGEGIGFEWAFQKTANCIKELVELVQPAEIRTAHAGELALTSPAFRSSSFPPPIILTCKSGDSLDHIADASVDAVVMDPPYYDNVMYAELSDFFYVWLKRTAGQVMPELFRRPLTDKENEAVANPAKFNDQKGAKALAGRDYQERMAAIFAECRRVLKPDGIMTLMFTHKATGAWDALTKGLMRRRLHHHRSVGRSTPRPKAACTSRTRRLPTARFSSPAGRAPSRGRCRDHVLGRRGAAGRRSRPQAGWRVSEGGHRRRGSLSRLASARRSKSSRNTGR